MYNNLIDNYWQVPAQAPALASFGTLDICLEPRTIGVSGEITFASEAPAGVAGEILGHVPDNAVPTMPVGTFERACAALANDHQGREGPHPTCVRWLGAYGRAPNAKAAAAFEAAPGRPVSAEAYVAGKSRLHNAGVGLLVDTAQTRLIRVWAGDAYTPQGEMSQVSQRMRELPSCGRWDLVESLPDEHGWYREALIADPVYTAVLVRRGIGLQGRMFAHVLAAALGLPVVDLDEVYHGQPDDLDF